MIKRSTRAVVIKKKLFTIYDIEIGKKLICRKESYGKKG